MKKYSILLCFIFLAGVIGAAPKESINQDSFYESFFEKTRLIMSKEEIQIYKHLPDREAREDFIKDFWLKRDPTPDTEDNEIKEEFEERIAYANRWFNERKSKERGWDTERGRILLQIGFPEDRQWGDVPDVSSSGRLQTTQPYPMEIWVYYRYQMSLIFMGDRQGFGTYRLARIPPQLGTILELSRQRLDLGTQKVQKNAFKFDADFKNGEIVIPIEVKRTSFVEKEGKMTADFRVEAHVYRDYKKIETIIEKKTISKDKDELLKTKTTALTISYSPPPEKGEYFFDIIVTDLSTAAKYRDFFKHKF